jgi:hypothetical protein
MGRWGILVNGDSNRVANRASGMPELSSSGATSSRTRSARPLAREPATLVDILVVNAVEAETLSGVVVDALDSALRAAAAERARRALPRRLQRLQLGHQARIARRIGAQLLQPQLDRLQVARVVLQPLPGRRLKPAGGTLMSVSPSTMFLKMTPAAPFFEVCHSAGSTWPSLIVGPAKALTEKAAIAPAIPNPRIDRNMFSSLVSSDPMNPGC